MTGTDAERRNLEADKFESKRMKRLRAEFEQGRLFGSELPKSARPFKFDKDTESPKVQKEKNGKWVPA